MSTIKQITWLLFALFILLGLEWHLASKPPITKKTPTNLAKCTDLIITNLTVTKFDENGKIINRLSSPMVKHIADQDTYFLQLPHISMSENNNPAWQIAANNAVATNGGEKITFTDHVIVWQIASATNPASTLQTEELMYFTQKKFASTTKLVQFTQAGATIYGEGMEAFLKDKQVRLLKNARATLKPQENRPLR